MGMGKPDWHADAPSAYTGRLSVRVVRLNGDYEPDGTYWGMGTPLYHCQSANDCEVSYYLRAADRGKARTAVLATYPKAKVRK